MNFRQLHRKTAPIFFLPLLATALTGVAYSLGIKWFGLDEKAATAKFFMTIHQGGFLGKPVVPIYVLLIGVGLLGLIITGLTMIKWQKSTSNRIVKQDIRWFHRILATIAFLPLILSASTGIIYRLGRAWFGLSEDQGEILLDIHQGSYFGSFLEPVYVLLVGLGLVALLVTGIQMTGLFRKRLQPSSEES